MPWATLERRCSLAPARQPGAGQIDDQAEDGDRQGLTEIDRVGVDQSLRGLIADQERDHCQYDGTREPGEIAELAGAERQTRVGRKIFETMIARGRHAGLIDHSSSTGMVSVPKEGRPLEDSQASGFPMAIRRSMSCAGIALSLVALSPCVEAAAVEPPETAPSSISPRDGRDEYEPAWAVFGQLTNVTQGHDVFRSPYSGANSLDPHGSTEETTDITAYLGRRLWRGAEFWINPEIDQGFGLSDTLGVAGFPSGEAYKIGANTPYLRLPRAFVRQYVPLGGAEEHVETTANQLSYQRALDSLTITAGKFSVVDIFDANRYAHDPRTDFMNWSLIDGGTFDYAADAWGFTYGAAAELGQGPWILRGGIFQLSSVPNAKITAVDFSQFSLVGEIERRYEWNGRPGKVKLLGFANRGKMGKYADAVLASEPGGTPSTAAVRQLTWRPGISVNFEQEASSELGVFARAGVNDGRFEAYEFTEINRTLSAGISLAGAAWGRPDDRVGVGAVVNALSGDARRYFAAGGLGILIGDGRLNYASEQIAEVYYAFKLNPHVTLSVDYQHLRNPAYNRDRGPVSIFAGRLHVEL
jgi:high affinity Mn2+ porin